MSDFRLFETDEFLKQFRKLSSQDSAFLQKKLKDYVYPQLKKQPFWGNNSKKLQGYSPATWRYRIGRFRLFYVINKKERIISILTVDLRKNAYR